MDLQLIEAYVPHKHFERIDESLQKYSHVSYWVSSESEDRKLIRMLVETSGVEEVLNYLESVSHVADGFEVMLFSVKTYITRKLPEEEEQKKKKEEEGKLQRASRHELIGTIERSSRITHTYVMMVILSAIVVTVGFIKDSEAIIIGSMVIAPMLGPIISTAFASILGDYKLLWKSSITLLFAIVVVILISVVFSLGFPVPFETHEFQSRTHVNLSDIVLALASGTAGALSILNRLPGSLVGVMVAVALLPPTVVFGMTLGEGMWQEAYGAFMLMMVNITSILLAAISVFTISGIRPVKWDEVQRAHTSKTWSLLFVSLVIIVLVVAIIFGERVELE